MKLTSYISWLSCISVLPSAFAFSVASVGSSVAAASASPPHQSLAGDSQSSTRLNMVASTPSTANVADMQRGIGGRIEDAFAAAKEKGEAAFVTFVTAGYPSKEGKLILYACCLVVLEYNSNLAHSLSFYHYFSIYR
jgi:hypothetical protein